jgi:hypothetical protein
VKCSDRGGRENKPFCHICHLGTDKSKNALMPQPKMFIYLFDIDLTDSIGLYGD